MSKVTATFINQLNHKPLLFVQCHKLMQLKLSYAEINMDQITILLFYKSTKSKNCELSLSILNTIISVIQKIKKFQSTTQECFGKSKILEFDLLPL